MRKTSGVNDLHFHLDHMVIQKNRTFNFHTHDDYEILYFLSGEVQYYIEDESYSLVSGDVLVIPPGKLHRLVTVNEKIVYERMVLTLSVDYCKRLLSRAPNSFVGRESKSYRISLGKNDGDFGRMMQSMLQLTADEAGMLTRDATVTLLLLHLGKYMDAALPADAGDNRRMGEIIRYINANFTRDLSLEEIAERFFISKYHLLRQFKNYACATVHSYILTKRISLAKALLREGLAPAEVCAQCGFSTYAGFYQNFVRQTGMSPSAFQKENHTH